MKEKWGVNYEANINKIKDAINDNKGEMITYEGDVISAYYFSMSNGMTENSKEVFNENKPYLVSVSSLETSNIKNYTRTKTFTKDNFCKLLSLSDCGSIKINKIEYNDTHHVSNIKVNNQSFKGTEFRKLLSLYSTDFTISIKDKIEIACNGHGHDVGMSQYGANLMAKQGYNYEEILKHYYTGVNIEKMNV